MNEDIPWPPIDFDEPELWGDWVTQVAERIHVTQRELLAILGLGYHTFYKWKKGARKLTDTKYGKLVQNALDIHAKLRTFPDEAFESHASFLEHILRIAPAPVVPVDDTDEYSNPNYYNAEHDYWRPKFLVPTKENWSRLDWAKINLHYNRKWGRDKKYTLPGVSGADGQWMREIMVSIPEAPPPMVWLHPTLQTAHFDTPPPVAMEVFRDEWMKVSACWQKTVLEQNWYWDATKMEVGTPPYFRAWQKLFIFRTYQKYDMVPSVVLEPVAREEELIG